MAPQHKRFQTNGTSALKADQGSFDVYAKPQFTSMNNGANIIDFNDARSGFYETRDRSRKVNEGSRLNPSKIFAALVDKARHDRILCGLFESQKGNVYRSSDLAAFAKGFTVTGFAAFILILFGC